MEILHSSLRALVPQMQTSDESDKHHQSSVDAGDAELKKQTRQANRLGNSQLRNHPKRELVQSAMQNIQQDQLKQLLQSTMSTFNGNTKSTNLENQDIPQLRSPLSSDSAEEKKESNSYSSSVSKTLTLLGKVMQLTNESSLNRLESQANSYLAMMDGAEQAYSDMAAQIEQMVHNYADAKDAYKAAQQQADTLANEMAQAQADYNGALAKLGILEVEAALNPPISAEMQSKIDAAKKEVASKKDKLTQATGTYNNFVENTLKPAKSNADSSILKLTLAEIETCSMISSYNSQQQVIIEERRKDKDPKSKSIAYLMALIAQMINKSANDELESGAELKKKLSEAAMADAKQKSKEYDEQVQKAEEMQKTMGCIGKLLGWVITAVSFVAAVFTGGASLVFAGVGLALTVGDEIGQALTGHSFMAEAMQPLMDGVIKPLMDVMGKIFTEILKAYGVDQKTAELVGQIFGAIAASLALIAAVVVVGKVASKVFDSVLQKVGLKVATEIGEVAGKEAVKETEKEVIKNLATTMEKNVAKNVTDKISKSTLKRLLDSFFGRIMKRLSAKFPKLFNPSEEQAAKNLKLTQKTVIVLDVVNTVSQSTIDIITADMTVEAAKKRKDLLINAAMQDLLNELLKAVISRFNTLVELVREIVENMTTTVDINTQTGRSVLRNTASIAG